MKSKEPPLHSVFSGVGTYIRDKFPALLVGGLLTIIAFFIREDLVGDRIFQASLQQSYDALQSDYRDLVNMHYALVHEISELEQSGGVIETKVESNSQRISTIAEALPSTIAMVAEMEMATPYSLAVIATVPYSSSAFGQWISEVQVIDSESSYRTVWHIAADERADIDSVLSMIKGVAQGNDVDYADLADYTGWAALTEEVLSLPHYVDPKWSFLVRSDPDSFRKDLWDRIGAERSSTAYFFFDSLVQKEVARVYWPDDRVSIVRILGDEYPQYGQGVYLPRAVFDDLVNSPEHYHRTDTFTRTLLLTDD